MTEYLELYTSWIVRGSYFNQILNCGPKYNDWAEHALRCVPPAILWEYRDKLAVIGAGAMDACRVAPALRKNRELIVLSERIFPKKGANEGDSKVRYFIFVVLHEIAHVIKNHRSPLLDNLTEEENEAQEKEAETLAISWFNAYIKERNNPYLKSITTDEIAEAKARNQELMEKAYKEG
jgi:hypothetical protein